MIGFPLLLVPFAIYNMVVFITPGVEWSYQPYTFTLTSGTTWGPTLGDALIVFSLLMLMFEFIKATSQGKSIVEHLLSLVLAGGAAAEFVMVKGIGTSVFALLVAICFVDLFAGFAASLRRARRAAAVGPAASAPHVEPPPVRTAPVQPVPPPVRAEPMEPPAIPVMPGRTEPVIRLDPVHKVEPQG